MSKGNKKRKKVSSSINTSLAYLEKVKRFQRTSEFSKAVGTLSSNVALRNKFNYRPNSYKSLSIDKRMYVTEPETELLWLSHLIQSHFSHLDTYIKIKAQYEKLILKGDFNSAVELLETLKERCGYSIWLIESLFFCHQQISGLEGNKKLLNEIFEDVNSGNTFNWVSYLAYLISERNEDINDFDFLRYKHTRILDDVNDEQFKQKLLTGLYYFVFDHVNMSSTSEIQQLLELCQSLSVIDTYNCVIRLLAENSFDNVFSNTQKLLETLPLLKDPKLNRLRLIHTNIESIEEESVEINDSFENVSYIQSCVLNPLFKIGRVPKSENKFINTYLQHVNNIFQKGSEFEQSIQYVDYLSLNLKHIDQSYALVLTPKELLESFNSYIYPSLSCFYAPFLDDRQRNKIIKSFYPEINDSDLSIIQKLEEIDTEFTLRQDYAAEDFNSDYASLKLEKLRVSNLLKVNKKGEAISIIANLITLTPLNVYFFELRQVCNGVSWREFKVMGIFVDVLIVLDRYLSMYNDDKQQFNLTACLRTFLNDCGKETPSELSEADFNGDIKKYYYFLNKVCSSFNLSQDSYSYSQPRDIVIERLSICEKLQTLAESPEVSEEIEELERKLAITDGLQEVDNVGLSVDQLRFFKEAKNKYLKTFERYKALKELVALPAFQNSILVPDDNSLFKSTLQESVSLMRTLLLELAEMFLKNEEFGLDYYLSMRIRHGRFMGVTRGPFERNKLVTKFSSEQDGYLDNAYWVDQLKHKLSPHQIGELNSMLAKFSSEIDELLTTFKDNYIQIRSDEKPMGLFSITITGNDVLTANSFIKESTSLDDFLKYVMELFVANLEECSRIMKSYISNFLLVQINDKIYQLQSNVSTLLNNHKNSELNTNIFDTRTQINKVLNDVESWFNISGENKKFNRAYTFNNIVDIALAKAKRVHTNFTPDLNIENKSTIQFHSNLLGILVDAFDILFSESTRFS